MRDRDDEAMRTATVICRRWRLAGKDEPEDVLLAEIVLFAVVCSMLVSEGVDNIEQLEELYGPDCVAEYNAVRKAYEVIGGA